MGAATYRDEERERKAVWDRQMEQVASLPTIVCISFCKKARPCLSPFFLGSLADLLATSNPEVFLEDSLKLPSWSSEDKTGRRLNPLRCSIASSGCE